MLILNITIHIYIYIIHTHIYPLISCYIMLYPCIISLYSCWMLASGPRPACWAAVGEETSTTWRIRSVCAGGAVAGRRFRSQFFVDHREFIEFKLENNQQNLGFLSWENFNLKISPKNCGGFKSDPAKHKVPDATPGKINRLWLCSSQINQVLCLNLTWLVVSIPLKNISQWEGLFHILWKKMFETTNQ